MWFDCTWLFTFRYSNTDRPARQISELARQLRVVGTHRLAGPMPPNWRVRENIEGLCRQEIGSEIDLVTWQYDLATNVLGCLPAAGSASGSAYSISTAML